MRREIAIIAGPRGWGDTRESWLAIVPRKVRTVTFRTVKALWYGEIKDPLHWAARDIRRAAELIEARKEARALYERIDRSKFPSYRGSNFALKHRWLWELKNGPVPKGHMLKCLDGNKLNTDPDNWVLVQIGIISRLTRRNYDDAPSELKQTIMSVSKLEHQIHSARDNRQ